MPEISVTFFADKDLMEEFEGVMEIKAKEIGFKLTKKQALQLAIKEAINNWKKENPGK